MKKISRRKCWISLLPWVLSFLWMGMIFLFSAQNADESSQLSGWTAFRSAFLLWPEFPTLPSEAQAAWIAGAQFWVRKTAHFLVYAGLGFWLCWGFSSFLWRLNKKMGFAWLVGTIYAATDEVHQLFVPGRSGQLRDVLLDSAGVLFGILFFCALTYLYKKAAAYAAAKKMQKDRKG